MDVFNQRISLEEAAAIAQRARSDGFLDAGRSLIVHHLGLMRARTAALQAAFPQSALHAVAIKANAVLAILSELVGTGTGLEAASIEEVHLALAAGCPAERIVFDSPAKTGSEIEQALAWGVHLNADSFEELSRIAAVRQSVVSRSIIGLRVNPQVGSGKIAHTSVAAANSKFGVPLLSNRARIIAACAKYDWLTALHVHVGSQGCELKLLADAVQRIAELRRVIVAETGRNITHVDIGGGLPTAYRTGDVAPHPQQYSALVKERAPELFGTDVRLITEFGRAIHANCGLALSRVEYVKSAQRLAVIHLGADLLLRPVYCPEDWSHEFFVLDGQGQPKLAVPALVTIAGPLCFGGDILARDVLLPPVEVGDWIVIRDVGAYTLSMWSRHCSRGMPPVLGYDPRQSDSLRVLRRGETPEDIVRFWG